MEYAIRLMRTGPPEVMEMVEIPLPDPGHGQVRIRNAAIAVNFRDIQLRSGRYPVDLPAGVGTESVGYVDAIGAGVVGLREGDRVHCTSPQSDAYSSVRLCPAYGITPIPEGMGFEMLAAIFSRGMFAWHLTNTVRRVMPGEKLLVYAAGSGVGSLVAQIATSRGAQVIGTVGSQERMQAARDAGCDTVLLSNGPDFSATVRKASEGGVHHVYDSIGAQTFQQSLECLRVRGTLIAFGNASGPIAPFSAMQELGMRGSLQLTWPMFKDFQHPDLKREALPNLLDLIETETIRLPIGQRYPLRQAAEAHAAIENRTATGATILTV